MQSCAGLCPYITFDIETNRYEQTASFFMLITLLLLYEVREEVEVIVQNGSQQ